MAWGLGFVARGQKWYSELEIRESELGIRESEDRGQRTEVGGQRTEDRGQKSEVRGRNKVFNHKGKLSFRRFLINEYIDKVFIAVGFNRRI